MPGPGDEIRRTVKCLSCWSEIWSTEFRGLVFEIEYVCPFAKWTSPR